VPEATIQKSRPVIVCEISDSGSAQYPFSCLAAFIKRNKLEIFPVEGFGRIKLSLEPLEAAIQTGNQDVVLESE
jgi:hypothetical protein